MGSSNDRPENPEIALQAEWQRSCATGVAFDVMLTSLFPETSATVSFSSSRRAEISMMLSQQEHFVKGVNSMLRDYYDRHPPTKERPAIIFVPVSSSAIVGAPSVPRTAVLAVLRDEWVRKLGLNKWRNSSMEQLKVLFPCMDWEHPSIQTLLRKEAITIHDINAQNLVVAGVSTSLDQVVAIMELDFDTTPSDKSQSGYHESFSKSYSSTAAPVFKLSQYFRQLMSHTRYRDWASGALVNGGQMSLVSHDREGGVQSTSVHLQSPAGFELFSRWVFSVGSRTLEQWGFSGDFGIPGSQIKGLTFKVPEHAESGCEDTIHLKFGEERLQPNCLFGPGTLYNVDVTTGSTITKGVCKISWPAVNQEGEEGAHCLIRQAQMIDPVHISEAACAWNVDKSGLPSRKLRPHCATTVEDWQKRVLRIVILPFYPAIHELQGEEFLAAFWDVMRCIVKLHEATAFYPPYLNVNNMAYTRDEAGQVVGVLSDFDLTAHSSGAASFMALDLLKQHPCKHELSHNFESALYILLWVALGYKGWKPPTGDPLSDWRRGTWAQIYARKRAFIVDSEIIDELISLITPEYEELVERIELLHLKIHELLHLKIHELLQLNIQQRRLIKAQGGASERLRIIGPMTVQEFFDILGPPPPGRDSYSQIYV